MAYQAPVLAARSYKVVWFFLLPVILLVRMGLNAVDGMLAREFGQKSRLGAVLNEVGDVLSDAALYLPLALVPQISSWSMLAFVLMAVVV